MVMDDAVEASPPNDIVQEGMTEAYKQTELGTIPKDWTIRRLGDVCTIFGRIGFRGYTVNDIVKEGEGPISLSPSNIQNGGLTTAKCTYVTWKKWKESPEIQVQNGDTILVKTGSTVGKTTYVKNLCEEATVNPQIVVLKKRKICDRFLGYVMAFDTIQGQLVSTTVGGALPTLSQKQVAEYSFPCPPSRKEQGAIADALSDADNWIDSLEALIAKKRTIKLGVMQEMLTGKRRLPGFTGEWFEKAIEEVAEVDSDNLNAGTDPNYVFQYISLEDVDSGVLKSTNEVTFGRAPSRARRRVRKDDVLFGTVRPNLQSHCIITREVKDYICSTGFAVIRCRSNEAAPSFIFAALFGDDVRRQIERLIAGSNYPAVNSRDVRELRIAMPGPDEQQAIASALTDIDDEIAVLEQKLAKVRQMKQGMMRELLTGRVRLV